MSESRKKAEIVMGSERSFGLTFAIVLAVIALWPLVRGGSPRLWAIATGMALLALAYLRPAVLRPFNIVWFRLGLLLSAVVTTVVMALLYMTTFVPISLVLRFRGRDLLGLRLEPEKSSYWIAREMPGPERGIMKRQF